MSKAAAISASPPGQSTSTETKDADDMNKLIMRYHGERIDFERVLKYLPNAAQQLKERKISIHEFSKNVTDVFWEMDNPVGVGFYEIIALIASFCWQQPIEALPEREIMFLNRFAVTITEAFFKEYDKLESLNDSVFFEAALLLLQSSFEKTCRAFSTLLDVSQFRGKQGAFLRWCPFYGIASLKKFADVLSSSLDVPNVCTLFIAARNAERRKEQVKRDAGLAAYALSNCLDDSWINCWECGKTAFCPICSRCSVAQYCGRDCQVKAWSRHKQQCARNKEAYDFLLENLRIINDAHEIGTMHGVRLNNCIDYLNTAPRLMDITLDQTNYGLPADGPSMVYFYQNIGHIARGDWWIWTEPDPLEQLERTSADACASQVNDISVLLSFDLHGYATSLKNGIVTSETIESIVMGHPFSSTHIHRIPAEYYLTVYQSHMNKRLDSNGREKYATVAKAQGLTFLKNKEY